jgi:hypothetical protein
MHQSEPASQNRKASTPTYQTESNISSPCHHVSMGGFLNQVGTAICSSAHATALSGVVQLAQGHPKGIDGAI